MEIADVHKLVAARLQQDWSLTSADVVSKETILQQLAERISYLMNQNMENFFQLMYRLDVPESKLTAMLFDQDAAQKIAALVYDRQLQKIKSRADLSGKYKSFDKDLEW